MNDDWKIFEYPGEINTYPQDIRDLLKGVSGDVEVRISSGGGDLFAGMAINNVLKRYQGGKTTAIIEGLAASAASVIAFACDEIKIPSNAYLMIHKPYCMAIGDSDEFLKRAEVLEELQDGIAESYLTKAQDGITKDQINDLINQESWFTGKKAREFFDVVVTEDESDSAKNKAGELVYNYTKVPEVLLKCDLKKMEEEIEQALIG